MLCEALIGSHSILFIPNRRCPHTSEDPPVVPYEFGVDIAPYAVRHPLHNRVFLPIASPVSLKTLVLFCLNCQHLCIATCQHGQGGRPTMKSLGERLFAGLNKWRLRRKIAAADDKSGPDRVPDSNLEPSETGVQAKVSIRITTKDSEEEKDKVSRHAEPKSASEGLSLSEKRQAYNKSSDHTEEPKTPDSKKRVSPAATSRSSRTRSRPKRPKTSDLWKRKISDLSVF